MRKLTAVVTMMAVLGTATFAVAGSKVKAPTPQLLAYDAALFVQQPPPPAGKVAPVPDAGPGKMALFNCVRYKGDPHPCGKVKVVKIVDPCWKPDPCNRCAKPKCVYVKICVPPCGCERVKVSKDGRKVKYDYGNYEVEVESKRGRIEVDYD